MIPFLSTGETAVIGLQGKPKMEVTNELEVTTVPTRENSMQRMLSAFMKLVAAGQRLAALQEQLLQLKKPDDNEIASS